MMADGQNIPDHALGARHDPRDRGRDHRDLGLALLADGLADLTHAPE